MNQWTSSLHEAAEEVEGGAELELSTDQKIAGQLKEGENQSNSAEYIQYNEFGEELEGEYGTWNEESLENLDDAESINLEDGGFEEGDEEDFFSESSLTIFTNLTEGRYVISQDGTELDEGTGPDSQDFYLDSGVYLVTFDEVEGYETPPPMIVDLGEGEEITRVANYVKYGGNIKIELSTDKGVYSILDESDKVISRSSDRKNGLFQLPIGQYTIRFEAIDDFVSPPPIDFEMERGSRLSYRGVYVSHKGTLGVQTNQTHARYRIVNEDGALVKEGGGNQITAFTLPVGKYTVQFDEVNGFETPGDIDTEVLHGGALNVMGSYSNYVGTLVIKSNIREAIYRILNSEGMVVSAGGGSQESSYALEAGSYIVEFGEVEEYFRPPKTEVTVKRSQEVYRQGIYKALETGGLKIKTNLEEGEFLILNEAGTTVGTGHGMSDLSFELPVGKYTIRPIPVSPYVTPKDIVVKVEANTLSNQIAIYEKMETGTLKVSTNAKTGQYLIKDANDQLMDKGEGNKATSFELPVGKYTIEFLDTWGYKPPGKIFIDLKKGSLWNEIGYYMENNGTLNLRTNHKDGKYAVHKTTAEGEKGEAVEGATGGGLDPKSIKLEAGDYFIVFEDIDKRVSPKDIPVTIALDASESVIGEYAHLPTLTVTKTVEKVAHTLYIFTINVTNNSNQNNVRVTINDIVAASPHLKGDNGGSLTYIPNGDTCTQVNCIGNINDELELLLDSGSTGVITYKMRLNTKGIPLTSNSIVSSDLTVTVNKTQEEFKVSVDAILEAD